MTDTSSLHSPASSGLAGLWQKLLTEMTPPAKPSLAASTSLRIRIARPLCIFFMIWVHVNPGVAELNIAEHGVRLADWYRFFFADGVGRTSIGLLAIASGFLAISTARIFPSGIRAEPGVPCGSRPPSLGTVPMAVRLRCRHIERSHAFFSR